MAKVEPLRGRLVLPASGTTPARLHVVHKAHGTRLARAVGVLGAALVLAPLVVLVPPHVVWPVLVLAAGLWLAWREWRGEYVVESFEGACPRCGGALELKPGARIRSGKRVECYGCHREPQLVLGAADEGGADA